METAFHNSTTSSSRGQNGNCISFAWDNNIRWELGTTTHPNDLRHNWNSFHNHNNSSAVATSDASTYHALLYSQVNNIHSSSALYGGGPGGVQSHPDPHLMCLKLGKRNYFEDASGRQVAGFSISKRGKTYNYGGGEDGNGAVTVAIPAVVPRCQVEGCQVVLLNAKEYHRRHKVCEVHSKAPKVVVVGLEQRFCQQCSRFHLVTEFDDTKRSCRRRLAGHNERRRKSSHENPTLPRTNNVSSQGRALSLLSSTTHESSISSPDLSSRCSAALQELIAEKRAALLARQLVVDKDLPFNHHTMEDQNLHQTEDDHHPLSSNQHHMFNDPQGWDRFDEPGTNNVTLDLMQAPTSAFELLSMRGKSKEEEEECSQLWSSFG